MYDYLVKPALEQAVTAAIEDVEDLLQTLRLLEEYIPQLPDKMSKKTHRTLHKMSDKLCERLWYYDGFRLVNDMLSKVVRTIPEEEEQAWLAEKIDSISALLARLKALPDDPELRDIGQSIYHEDSLRNLDRYIAKYEELTKV